MCHFVVEVVQEHLHTQSSNSCFREGQAQPGLQPESKELSRLGPGLPWPLLSCRSWGLTLATETHDRVWTGTARAWRGPQHVSVCASSSVHPAAMVEPQAGQSLHTSKCTTSRTCLLGRPWPLPLTVARPAEGHCKLLQQVQIQVNRDETSVLQV